MPAPPPPPRLPAHPHHSLEDRDAAILPASRHRVGRPRAWKRVAAAGAAPAFRAAAAPARIIPRPAPECIQTGGRALYWHECAQSTSCLHVRGCADGQQGPGRRRGRPRRAGAQCSTLAELAPRPADLLAASSSAATSDARREVWPRNCRRACLTSMTQPCTVLGCSLSDP